jgi:hypothetical protein
LVEVLDHLFREKELLQTELVEQVVLEEALEQLTVVVAVQDQGEQVSSQPLQVVATETQAVQAIRITAVFLLTTITTAEAAVVLVDQEKLEPKELLGQAKGAMEY